MVPDSPKLNDLLWDQCPPISQTLCRGLRHGHRGRCPSNNVTWNSIGGAPPRLAGGEPAAGTNVSM